MRMAHAARLLAGLAAWMAASSCVADTHRWVLLSSDDNIRVDNCRIDSQQLGLAGAWSITKETLHGGMQEGVDLVTVDSGRMRITVIPTRGMGILRVECGNVRLGWDSPVKEVVHPRFIRLGSRGGLGWLEGFNEWLVRCGLEFAGGPGMDKYTTNTGAQAEMMLTLHGKIANISASRVELEVDSEPPHTIRLRGTVHERSFYGPNLELTTELSVTPGATGFRVSDTVTNRGAYEQEMMLIYHTNFGPPLLGEGSRLVAAVESVQPANAHAAEGVGDWNFYRGPTPGWIEQVYLIHPRADGQARTMAVLRNPAGDRAASISWSTRELPYLTLWKNTAPAAAGYVTGIEPATCFPFNRSVERRTGRVVKLKPGAARRVTIDYGVHAGADEVQRVLELVRRIQSGAPVKVIAQPPNLD